MDKDILINGVRLHYTDNVDAASNPQRGTLVLMHGWGCTHETLLSLERVALGCGFRVVNVDFPGFGQSQEPPSAWGVDAYTDVMEQLLGHEGIDSPVLLGHSFGGRVGIAYASRNSGVKALILVDAAGVKPRRSLRYYCKVWSYKAMKRLMYIVYGREGAGRRLEARRSRSGSADYASASPVMRGVLSRVVNEDLRHLMPAVQCPTLLIWGEDDTATPMRDARIMERLIPGAALVSFARCGHYSFLDNPGQFAAVLRSFLCSL